jgi:hypothetical protein
MYSSFFYAGSSYTYSLTKCPLLGRSNCSVTMASREDVVQFSGARATTSCMPLRIYCKSTTVTPRFYDSLPQSVAWTASRLNLPLAPQKNILPLPDFDSPARTRTNLQLISHIACITHLEECIVVFRVRRSRAGRSQVSD